MKILSLDGRSYEWSLSDYVGKHSANSSALHNRAREFLHSYYPAFRILEEVFVPGEKLYLDFYINKLSLCIECQGIQHEKRVGFFNSDKHSFYKAKGRDNRKREWCELNNISLVYFYPEEDESVWRKKMDKV